MVEQKFSLELTRNGIQQTVYAKEGEALARKIIITLTNKGEVVSLTGYDLKVFLDDGTYCNEEFEEHDTLLLKNNGVSATFILPQTLCASPGERLCELQLSRNSEIVYSAQFRVTVEETFGATASAGAITPGVEYELLLMDAQTTETLQSDAKVPVISETTGATRLIAVDKLTENIDERLTDAEGDIDDIEEDIGDINTALEGKADTTTVNAALALKADASDVTSALALKADASTVNTALAGKVDIISGKGLSTNDYDATEKANVAANTLARHTHSNKTVLDKFGESSGTPTYDGNPIGGGTITDVQDTDGNSLVSDGVATIPKEVVEIYNDGTLIGTLAEINEMRRTKELKYQSFEFVYINQHTSSPVTYAVYYIRPTGAPNRPSLYLDIFNANYEITGSQGKVADWSDENYTSTEKTKLSGIATGAEVNKIETIKKSDGTALTITNKSVTLPEIPVAPTDAEMIEVCSILADFITDGTNIIGVDSTTALAF